MNATCLHCRSSDLSYATIDENSERRKIKVTCCVCNKHTQFSTTLIYVGQEHAYEGWLRDRARRKRQPATCNRCERAGTAIDPKRYFCSACEAELAAEKHERVGRRFRARAAEIKAKRIS